MKALHSLLGVATVLAIMIPLICHGESTMAPEYEWTKMIEPAAFAPRDGAGALVFKNRMWLLGGWNPRDPKHFPKITNNEVWSSANGLEWKLETESAPWEGRHTAGYVVFKDKMWIVGGDANRSHYQNDVWSSADGVNWDLVCEEVPWRDRVLHCTAVFQAKIWVFGGQNMPGFVHEPEDIFYADAWNSEDGKNWTKVADDLPWGPRGMVGKPLVFKNRIWLLGGGTYNTPKNPERIFYNDVWSSDDGIHWEQHLSSAPWAPRQMLDVAAFDNRMWVLEGWGRTEGNLNDVWYSEDGHQWTEVSGTPWAPRHAGCVFVFENALWMVAGNNLTADVWKLTRKRF
jgi:hypothetical protein